MIYVYTIILFFSVHHFSVNSTEPRNKLFLLPIVNFLISYSVVVYSKIVYNSNNNVVKKP